MSDILRSMLDRIIALGPPTTYDKFMLYDNFVPELRAKIVGMGMSAIPILLETLDDDDPYARKTSAELLAEIGDPHILDDIRARLPREKARYAHSGDEEDRLAVSALEQALAACGGEKELKQFVEMVETGNSTARTQGLNALVAAGQRALPYLARLVRSRSSDKIRAEAMLRLGYNYKEAVEVVDVALEALRDSCDEVRQRAAAALGESRTGDPRVAAGLLQALQDKSPLVCAAAATRLKTRAVIPEAVPPLTAMLDEDDQQVVFQALETLVYYVHGNNLALDTIDPVLRCADPTRFADNTSLKNKVALILGAAGDPRGAPGLVYIMGCRGNRGRPKDKHHPAAYALRALERIGAEQVTPELIPLLSHEDIVIRHNAAYALGILKAADALDALQALAEHDDNGGVRGVAMTAIRRIKRR